MLTKTLYKCVFCGTEEVKYTDYPHEVPKGFMPLITGACGDCVRLGMVTSMEDLDARCVALGESISARN